MSADSSAGPVAGGVRVAFEWRLNPEDDEAEARRFTDALQSEGGEARVRPRPTGALLVAIPLVIFGVVAGVALVEQVIDWWRDRNRKGLLIHVGADGKVDIRPLDIPYGRVLFVTADGKTLEYVDVSDDQMKRLLEAAAKGVAPAGGKAAASHGGEGK